MIKKLRQLRLQFIRNTILSSDQKKFMAEAIRLAIENAHSGKGGPFGAVVVKNTKIIARSANQVLLTHDPSAHAEIVAIREACHVLGYHQLEGCDIYSSCEPCPMCLGAIYWARPDRVFYAATREDANDAGFDDSFIYKEIKKTNAKRNIPFIRIKDEKRKQPFEKWNTYEGRDLY